MSLIFYFTRLHNCFSNKFDPHLIKNFKYFSHKHVSIYLRLPYACNLKKKKKKKEKWKLPAGSTLVAVCAFHLAAALLLFFCDFLHIAPLRQRDLSS